VRFIPEVEIAAAFDLSGNAERLQTPWTLQLAAGVPITCWAFSPRTHGPARLRLAVRAIRSGQLK
jgi:hypothetical protein